MLSLGHAPKRKLPKRRRMTLISAFRTDRGAVLHADSEENFGSFRRSVQKIVPKRMGNLDVIIAGSGIGQLIEGFTGKLKEHLDSAHASRIEDVKHLVEQRLPSFYSQVATSPAPNDIKQQE